MACARWTKLKSCFTLCIHKDTKPNTVCVVHCSVKGDVLDGEILRGSQRER
ncbi:unnamed protein product [Brassica rapa subsp. trilocularis]